MMPELFERSGDTDCTFFECLARSAESHANTLKASDRYEGVVVSSAYCVAPVVLRSKITRGTSEKDFLYWPGTSPGKG
jgi:hypothetical protein